MEDSKCKIETNVAVPAAQAVKSVYPFESLTISTPDEKGELRGDCFIAGKYTREKMQSISGSIAYQKKKHPGREFAMRHCTDGYIRVWRTA